MKAPISDRVGQILSDPNTAHELVKQVIEGRRGSRNAEINIGTDRFELVRVTAKSISTQEKKA